MSVFVFDITFMFLMYFLNRKIDREEFNKVIALMRAQKRQGAQYKDGKRLGQKAVEKGGLLEYFFGKDGKTCLRHETFVQFLRDLHNEVNNSLSLSLSIEFFGKRRKGILGIWSLNLNCILHWIL